MQVTATLSLRDHFGKVRPMNDSTNRLSEFFESSGQPNTLWRYVQSMSPETAAQLSKPESPEVLQVMERNIVGLLGGLPAEQFDVAVTTSREGLGRLLASAMMSGYFLRNVEQRMDFERSFQSLELGSSEDSQG
jgi:Protein of unknown function (DUF760)